MMPIDGSKNPLVSLGFLIVASILASAASGQYLSDFAGPCTAAGDPDFNDDGTVNFLDFAILASYWDQNEPSLDLAPAPPSDGVIDLADLTVLTTHWLADTAAPVYIEWLGHSSVKIWTPQHVVYIDPRNLAASPHDATVVLVTHTHGDHYAPGDIAGVWAADTVLIAPPDVVASHGSGRALAPGQTFELEGVAVTGVPAYNTNKPNHPRANNWLGYIVEIDAKRIYCAGDTDLIEEMKALPDIDVAILPAGGTYTMNAMEAAQATEYIQLQLAIPYHWGEIVGSQRDAETFARFAACEVKILAPGETLSSKDWHREFSLVAHWPLDEFEGVLAMDAAGSAPAR